MKCVRCISRRLACGQLDLAVASAPDKSVSSRTASIVQRGPRQRAALPPCFGFSLGERKRIDGLAAMAAAAVTPLSVNRLSTRPAISGEARAGARRSALGGTTTRLRSRFGKVAHRSDSFREQHKVVAAGPVCAQINRETESRGSWPDSRACKSG